MLQRMGEIAQKTVSLSINSYIEGSTAYSKVRNLSFTLISMSDEAESKTLELMARFQPVASDLRILKSYMKIAYDFERYGRYALDISQAYEKLGGMTECEDWIKKYIAEMSGKVLSMVQLSVDSLKSYDTKLAKNLSETEKQVDSMYLRYLDRLVERAPAANRCTISSVLVTRYLERIADHAIYIGESIIYLATGEKVAL